MPAKSHGLNLPYLLLVHSMILPMIGSLKASKTRAPIIIPVMAVNCAAVSEWVNKTKVKR